MSKREYPLHPHVGVGAVVTKGETILLVRRGRPPGRDLWAIPGGRLRLGETLQEAAEREIREETGVVIRAGDPIHAFDFIERDRDGRIRFHYVIVDLQAEYVEGEPCGNDDALEARWLTGKELKELKVSQNTLNLLGIINFLTLEKNV